MELIYRIQVNIVAFVFLLLVLWISSSRLDRKNRLNKVFALVSLVILVQLTAETITCIINHNPNPVVIFFSHFFHSILYLVAPLLSLLWYLLLRQLVLQGSQGKKMLWPFFIPVLLGSLLVFLNPFFGFAFSIDSSGTYHREWGFYILSGLTYFYLFLAVLYAVRHRHRLVRQEYYYFLAFSIVPLIGGFFQIVFYGMLLMWSTTAFALVFLYIFLQERLIHVDHLTGAWTRQSLMYYIEREFTAKTKKKFAMIFFDVDKLKEINDGFGHQEGDQALIDCVDLIHQSIDTDHIVARFGGDEFAIVFEIDKPTHVELLVKKIKQAFADRNSNTPKPYPLHCSFGAGVFDERFPSIDDFLRYLDTLMYGEKTSKKNNPSL